MSTPVTVPLGTGGGVDDVRTFVAAVRARLDDLTPEEVEELTGGLEADMSEALAGTGEGPRSRFGDPAAYADELRSAAGLAPRSGGGDRSGLRTSFAGASQRLRAHPAYEPVREFLVVLRPAWWVARGLLAAGLLMTVLGLLWNPVGWLLILAAVVASVELGRRSARLGQGAGVAVTVLNVLVVLEIVVAALAVGSGSSSGPAYYEGEQTWTSGLSNNGEPVYNIFPYDADGNPLKDVRLYDDRGRALAQSPDSSTYWDDGDADGQGSGEWALVPRAGVGPDQPRNVYPLLRQPIDQDYGTASQQPEEVKLPFGTLPPLLAAPGPSVTPTPEPTADATTAPPPVTPAPSATEAPSATAAPTP